MPSPLTPAGQTVPGEPVAPASVKYPLPTVPEQAGDDRPVPCPHVPQGQGMATAVPAGQ